MWEPFEKYSSIASHPHGVQKNFTIKIIVLQCQKYQNIRKIIVFYIMNSTLVNKLLQCLDKYQFIERNFVQSILFGLVYYMISVNL